MAVSHVALLRFRRPLARTRARLSWSLGIVQEGRASSCQPEGRRPRVLPNGLVRFTCRPSASRIPACRAHAAVALGRAPFCNQRGEGLGGVRRGTEGLRWEGFSTGMIPPARPGGAPPASRVILPLEAPWERGLWASCGGQHYTHPPRASGLGATSHPLAARTLVGATRWPDRLSRGRRGRRPLGAGTTGRAAGGARGRGVPGTPVRGPRQH